MRSFTGICVLAWMSLLSVGSTESRSLINGYESSTTEANETNEQIYQSYAESYIPPQPWPAFYGLQQTGAISTVYDCGGNIGPGFAWVHYPSATRSFETPADSRIDYLFAGSLWIGGIVGNDTLVSTGLDGWSVIGNEFYPSTFPGSGSVTPISGPADYSLRTVFYDTLVDGVDPDYTGRPHIPMNLRITSRSHAWHTAPYNNLVIYDIVITNIGDRTVEKTYVGQYFDADIYWVDDALGYLDDLSGSLRSHCIGYAIDNDGDPSIGVFHSLSPIRIFAARILACSHPIADTNFNWWWSSISPDYDFGPRLRGTVDDPFFDFGTGGLGTPDGDINKYYILSHKEWDYDQIYTASFLEGISDTLWLFPDPTISFDIAKGTDTKFLLSAGPFDIYPDSSVRLIFTTFTGDSVHVDPTNGSRLPNFPDGYLSRLNFEDVLANAAAGDTLAQRLLDPLNPVSALEIVQQGDDSAVVAWDPWVCSDVLGYELYLSPVPEDSLPYPGIVPPWLEPETLVPYASVGVVSQFTFAGLDRDKFYFCNAAHRAAAQVGQPSPPVFICTHTPTEGPQILSNWVFYSPGESTTINWLEPPDVDVDYYSIYRFEDTIALLDRYDRFYDSGFYKDFIVPADTFEVNGKTYYYYTMKPYAIVDSGVTSFEDINPLDGAYYLITFTNKAGFESRFSAGMSTFVAPPQSRDILLVTQSSVAPPALTYPDTIAWFYDQILDGYNYDIYYCRDTETVYSCYLPTDDCLDWRDLAIYRLVILDDDLKDRALTTSHEDLYASFAKYLASGGRMAYFGPLSGLNTLSLSNSPTSYYQSHWFTRRFFGIDSIFFCSPLYYLANPPDPFVDTLFGFIEAEATSANWPSLVYDTSRFPFQSVWSTYWPDNSAPGVSTFAVNDMGEITHNFKSGYPASSLMEGKPVGVHTVTDEAETYLFGFHLWYMEPTAARQLIDDILLGSPTSAENPEGTLLPRSIALSQNYPNPFNPNTMISFELPSRAAVTLEVFNILGQRVRTLVNAENLAAGSHLIEWDGTSDGGKTVSTGIYFYRLTTPETSISRKMMLIK